MDETVNIFLLFSLFRTVSGASFNQVATSLSMVRVSPGRVSKKRDTSRGVNWPSQIALTDNDAEQS